LNNYKGRTKEGYETALNSFNKFHPNRDFNSISPKLVKKYKSQLSECCSANTVHTYLRKLDTLWSEISELKNPFKGIRPKLTDTRDKYLSDEDFLKIRDTCTIPWKYKNRYTIEDLNRNRKYWLLLFYLGGIDMFDLARLRYDENVINGRIEFKRAKGSSGAFCSNILLPEGFDCYLYLVPIYKY